MFITGNAKLPEKNQERQKNHPGSHLPLAQNSEFLGQGDAKMKVC